MSVLPRDLHEYLRNGSQRTVAFGLVPAAFLVGAATAIDPRAGIGLLLALLFLPVLMFSLPLAVAAWFPLVFLEGLAAFNLAAKAGGFILTVAWLTSIRHWIRARQLEPRIVRSVLLMLAVLLLWLTLSLAWAEDSGAVLADLWRWYAVALLMLVVATTIKTTEHIRFMLWGFVIGATVGVMIGVASGGLGSTAMNAANEGRLTGAQGDPNFLAAGIVPAMVLALALIVTTRNSVARTTLFAAFLLLALGLIASESRGGILAALATVLVATLVFRRGRAAILGFTMVIGAVFMIWFSLSPTAWDRVSSFEGGSGRDELWTVATRMAADRPILGAGLNNFPVAASDYVREPGTLTRLDLIVEEAHVVHSVYLQAAAETGYLGLLLFLGLVFLCLRASWLAARRFDRAGDSDSAVVARSVLVATVALLAASTFISNGVDKRLWVLFGLSVALFSVAAAQREKVNAAKATANAEAVFSVSGPAADPSAVQPARSGHISVGNG